MTRRRTVALCIIVIAIGLAVPFAWPSIRRAALGPDGSTQIKVSLRNVDRTDLISDADGQLVYRLTLDDGDTLILSPNAYAKRVRADMMDRPWYLKVMNITSPINAIWVFIGFSGQILFAGRSIVQWIASERERRSVVPTAFWWMALGGASMLLVYFIWRKDIVGILGQATGWTIYMRNLYFIYIVGGHQQPAEDVNVTDPEAAAD